MGVICCTGSRKQENTNNEREKLVNSETIGPEANNVSDSIQKQIAKEQKIVDSLLGEQNFSEMVESKPFNPPILENSKSSKSPTKKKRWFHKKSQNVKETNRVQRSSSSAVFSNFNEIT